MRKVITLILIMAVAVTAVMAADEPGWVKNWERYYPETQYLGAVGYGTSRDSADSNAKENLAAIFGVSVDSTTTTSTVDASMTYDNRSATFQSDSFSTNSEFDISVSNLVYTSIVERYDNGKEYISLAVMDKPKAITYYIGKLREISSTVDYYMTIDPSILTLDSYYTVINLGLQVREYQGYLNILQILSPGVTVNVAPIPSEAEVLELVERLSFNVSLSIDAPDDDWYLVEGEVLSALHKLGVSPSDGNGRYVLSEQLEFERTDLPGNPLKFIVYSLVIRVKDTVTGKNVFTWRGNGREGQASYSAAENRAVTALSKKIRNDFMTSFSKSFNLTPLYD